MLFNPFRVVFHDFYNPGRCPGLFKFDPFRVIELFAIDVPSINSDEVTVYQKNKFNSKSDPSIRTFEVMVSIPNCFTKLFAADW